jgi:hypothetical protein
MCYNKILFSINAQVYTSLPMEGGLATVAQTLVGMVIPSQRMDTSVEAGNNQSISLEQVMTEVAKIKGYFKQNRAPRASNNYGTIYYFKRSK